MKNIGFLLVVAFMIWWPTQLWRRGQYADVAFVCVLYVVLGARDLHAKRGQFTVSDPPSPPSSDRLS